MRKRTSSSIAAGRRRGFTLLELMMAIGIILLLAGILLPMIVRARRTAQLETMELNLHAIGTALDAYKLDFGDYPRNPSGLTDGLFEARTDPTLAMALIGPGPAGYILPTGSPNGYANGDVDGADGTGFRTSFQAYPVTITTNNGVSMTLSMSGSASPFSTMPTFISFGEPVQVRIGTIQTTVAMVPITNVAVILGAGGNNLTINIGLPYAPININQVGTNASLMVPTGRIYSYLPADKFKVKYLQGPNDAYPLPVLLDSWGQPIMYFPLYNRQTAGETQYLFGSPGGLYAHVVAVTTPAPPNPPVPKPATLASMFWDGPIWWWTPDGGVTWDRGDPAGGASNDATMNADLLLAAQWKLGDNSTVYPDNIINKGETLNLPKDFILISAGPNGVFFDPTQTSNSGMIRYPTPTPPQLNQEIKDWGNVYNIDQ